jgi:hypothetical protein
VLDETCYLQESSIDKPVVQCRPKGNSKQTDKKPKSLSKQGTAVVFDQKVQHADPEAKTRDDENSNRQKQEQKQQLRCQCTPKRVSPFRLKDRYGDLQQKSKCRQNKGGLEESEDLS